MAATTYYLRNTQTGGGTGGTVYDLSGTQGTNATLSASVSSNTFAEVLRFQITLGSALPQTDIPFSVSINAISANSEVRWRIQELNSSNTVVASSAYATAQTTTGTKTGTISFSNTWAANDRLAISVEYRRTGGTGSRTLTLNINNANTYIQPDLVIPTQTLTPALFTNTNTFYAATVAAGAVALLPGLFTNTNTFHAPTATTAYTLVANRFDNTQTFYAPEVEQGAGRELQVSYVVFDTLASGVVTLLPARLENSQVFYEATVTPGSVELLPDRWDNTSDFYESTVSQAGASTTLLPSRYDNLNEFFAAVLEGGEAPTAVGGLLNVRRRRR